MKKLFVFMTFATMLAAGGAAAQQHNITLEDIWTKRTFSPRGIGALRSMADGEHYCTMNSMGIAKYSYATGEKVEDVCLFSGPAADPRMKKKAAVMPRMDFGMRLPTFLATRWATMSKACKSVTWSFVISMTSKPDCSIAKVRRRSARMSAAPPCGNSPRYSTSSLKAGQQMSP